MSLLFTSKTQSSTVDNGKQASWPGSEGIIKRAKSFKTHNMYPVPSSHMKLWKHYRGQACTRFAAQRMGTYNRRKQSWWHHVHSKAYIMVREAKKSHRKFDVTTKTRKPVIHCVIQHYMAEISCTWMKKFRKCRVVVSFEVNAIMKCSSFQFVLNHFVSSVPLLTN